MSRSKYSGFQELLHEEFVVFKKHSVIDTARKMNVPASSLYHYIEGEMTFPPDLIAHLYNATRNPAFLNFILNDTDQQLTPKQKPDGMKSIIAETLDVTSAVGLLSSIIQEALEDEDISSSDWKKIMAAKDKAIKELEDITARRRK